MPSTRFDGAPSHDVQKMIMDRAREFANTLNPDWILKEKDGKTLKFADGGIHTTLLFQPFIRTVDSLEEYLEQFPDEREPIDDLLDHYKANGMYLHFKKMDVFSSPTQHVLIMKMRSPETAMFQTRMRRANPELDAKFTKFKYNWYEDYSHFTWFYLDATKVSREQALEIAKDATVFIYRDPKAIRIANIECIRIAKIRLFSPHPCEEEEGKYWDKEIVLASQ